MNEDERYRSSTQYKLWSYTPEALTALRETTNQIAAQRVQDAVQRIRASRAASAPGSGETSEAEQNGNGTPSKTVSILPEGDINCLTAEEELRLMRFYLSQTIQLGDHLNLPTDIKATAVQYIKRFYITNSVMTYHPTDILKTALFFATKTENHYIRLTKFAESIPKTKPEDVLASEFLLTQGLRFTFDVRHPFRALEGAVMELQALATAGGSGIPPLPGQDPVHPPAELGNVTKRVRDAHGKARETLKTSAILSDAYFHYTPSQIMFASLLLADRDLTTWYVKTKIPVAAAQLLDEVMSTIEACAAMLNQIPPTSSPSEAEMKELKALNAKLKKCRNPEKMDLVARSKAVKREGGEEGLDEKVIKKRKLERERVATEGEDLFGPALKKS